MPKQVCLSKTIELPHAREALWPILSKTDWVNRAIGLPPVNYEIRPLPDGGGDVTGRFKAFGLNLAWKEYPFEWIEAEYYQVRRAFLTGPFAEAMVGMRFRERPAGCAIEIHARFQPRNFFGEFIARHWVGPRTLSHMLKVVQGVNEHLTNQRRPVMPKLPVSAVNVAALTAGLNQLRAQSLSATTITQLETLLTESPDVELSHLRPFAVARRWQAERWETLRLFLHATRAGLLNLRWEVLCPNCRSTRLPRATSLNQLARLAHCDVCNIKFDAEFDKSVELKFSVHPSVRAFEDQTFCLGGPGGRPHIVGQLYVEPGQTREWELPAFTGDVRLRSPQVKTPITLPAADAEITCRPAGFDVKVAPTRNAAPKVTIHNPNAFAVLLALERQAWDEDILTASRATNWQEFRDLFATEVISPTEQIVVGSQVIVFTDLRGSTAMYNRIGDAPAYVLVRDHFKILHDVLVAHHGTLVKTIGDAVMAVFSNLPEALAAVQQMHEHLAHAKLESRPPLQLKSSLHTGACLAVNANDRLDFFGTTVNFAARLIEHAEGDDLVLADAIYWRPETQEFLGRLGGRPKPGEERFTGFTDAVKVWSIPMLSPGPSDIAPSERRL